MKTNTRARRRRTNTLLLVGTFGVGIAMGFTLCFTLIAIAGLNFSGEVTPVAETPAAAETPITIPEPVNTAVAPEDVPATPTTETLQNIEGEMVMVSPEPEEDNNTENTVGAPVNAPELASEYADTEGLWPARHLIIGIEGSILDEATASLIKTYKPGGVLLEEHNFISPVQSRGLIIDIKTAAGYGQLASDIPLIMVEQDGGIIGNPLKLNPAPSPADLSSVGDLEEVTRISDSYATVAKDLGVGVILSPSLDVYREGQSNPEFATQSFGGDPETITYYGVAFAEGILNQKLIPVAKHFPGIGTGHINDKGVYVVDEKDEKALSKLFYPFAEVATRRIPGILVSHVAVPQLEDVKPAPPASMSEKLVSGFLRKMWAYDGVLIADDFTLHPAVNELPLGESVVRSLAIGADTVILLQVNAETLENVCKAITEAVVDGTIKAESLATSKARLDVWHSSIARDLGVEVSHPTPPQVVRPTAHTAGETPVEAETVEEAIDTTAETPAPITIVGEGAAPQTKTVKHRIEKGESLDSIAKKYKVNLEDLKKWNNLKDNNIKFGYSLIVNVSADAPGIEAAPETETPDEAVKVDAPLVVEPAPEPVTEAVQEEVPTPEVVVEAPVEEAPPVETPAEETPESAPVEEAALLVEEIPIEETPAPVVEAPTEVVAEETPMPETAPEEAVVLETPIEETTTPETETPAPEIAEEVAAPVEENELPTEAVATENTELKTFTHELKSGEHLTFIANKYGVTISDIKEWNGLTDDKVVIGKKLKIRVTANKVPEGAQIVEEETPQPATSQLNAEEATTESAPDGTEPEPAPEETITPEAEAIAQPAPEETVAPQPEAEPMPEAIPVVEEIAAPTPEAEALPEVKEESNPAPPENAVKSNYKVASGDTLFGISKKYNIPVNRIMEWNNLKDGKIKTGMSLLLYAPVAAQEETSPVGEITPAPEAAAPPVEPAPVTETPEITPTPAQDNAETQPPNTIKYKHTVRFEQNLEGIATAYEVTAADIMKWNNLSSGEISEGQELVIYMPE